MVLNKWIGKNAEETKNMPDAEYLIEGLLCRNEFGVIFGSSGSMKTFVVLDLLFSLMVGKQFADTFNIPKNLTVAYASGEGNRGIKKRFKALENKYNVDLDDSAKWIWYNELPQLYDETHPDNVDSFIEGVKASGKYFDLLVIDPYNLATIGSQENSNGHAAIIHQSVQKIIDAFNCSVIIVHHSDKAGNTYRGASALKGFLNVMIEIKNGKMICEKSKDEEPFSTIQFTYTKTQDSLYIEWLTNYVEETKSLTIPDRIHDFLVKTQGKHTSKEIAQALGLSDNQVYKVIKKIDGIQSTLLNHSLVYFIPVTLFPSKEGEQREQQKYVPLEQREQAGNKNIEPEPFWFSKESKGIKWENLTELQRQGFIDNFTWLYEVDKAKDTESVVYDIY